MTAPIVTRDLVIARSLPALAALPARTTHELGRLIEPDSELAASWNAGGLTCADLAAHLAVAAADATLQCTQGHR